MSDPIYREEQKIAPKLMRLVVWFLIALACVLAVGQHSFKPIRDMFLPVLFVLIIAEAMRLITEVRDDGIYVRLTPFPFRRIPFDEIASATVRRYRPLVEYGGYGIRYGWNGMAYNADGVWGVQLVLANGKKILIGSQRSEDLAVTVNAMKR